MQTAWKLIPLAVALSALGACGTRTHTREIVREPVQAPAPVVVAPAPATVERLVVIQPPAAPQEAVPPAPSAGYSWVAGHHEWRNGNWVWLPGQWVSGTVRPLPQPMPEAPPTAAPDGSARWVPGHWSFSGNDWVWVRGRWM